MFRKILGPSPAVQVLKKVHSHLFFNGGDTTDTYLSAQEFVEVVLDKDSKSARLKNIEVTEMLFNKAKKLTKNKKLVKSIVEQAKVSIFDFFVFQL